MVIPADKSAELWTPDGQPSAKLMFLMNGLQRSGQSYVGDTSLTWLWYCFDAYKTLTKKKKKGKLEDPEAVAGTRRRVLAIGFYASQIIPLIQVNILIILFN